MNGPIPLALYMKQCLTSTTHGYYTTPPAAASSTSASPPNPPPDPFGSTGDFITSPELTQIFGELLALWLLTEWLGQGRRSSGVNLIELGPGRGTLMADVLRTLGRFPEMRSAVERVYLVEASPGLREKQGRVLCGGEGIVKLGDGSGWRGKAREEFGGMEVVWVEDFELIPKGNYIITFTTTLLLIRYTNICHLDTTKSPFLLAHEFFDALPIHAFQATRHGWRELLVSHRSLSHSHSPANPTQDPFYLTLSPAPTPYSTLLPTLSPRHPPLLTRASLLPPSPTNPPITIEISPLSLTLIESIAHLLARAPAGAALIIDYGPKSTTPSNSLRGIARHKLVSPFANPGRVDLSADVDFTALAERAVAAEEGVEVFGPVEQAGFLGGLGGGERVRMVLEGVKGEEERLRVRGAWDRLVGTVGGGMGGVYKALAVVKGRGGRRPVGFGGGVVEE